MPVRRARSPMAAPDDELRRLAHEAAEAARAAREAAERATRQGGIEETLRGVSHLLDTLLRNLLFGVRSELARALAAVSRTGRLLQHAVFALVVALVLVVAGLVVLAVGTVQLFNALLQPPWGTLVAGGVFLALGLLAALLVRGRLRAIGREAEGLLRR